jgi:hypothetical protein
MLQTVSQLREEARASDGDFLVEVVMRDIDDEQRMNGKAISFIKMNQTCCFSDERRCSMCNRLAW